MIAKRRNQKKSSNGRLGGRALLPRRLGDIFGQLSRSIFGWDYQAGHDAALLG